MKKVLWAIAFLPLLWTSCSSSDSSDNPAPTDLLVKTVKVNYTDPSQTDSDLLFTYEGNVLKTIKDAGVLIQEYIYTNNKLTRINFPADNMYTLIEYNSEGKIAQYIVNEVDYDVATKYVITYSGNTFTRTLYDGDLTSQTELSGTETVTVQNGNITQDVRDYISNTETGTFSYDTKNNPFKNINNYDVFIILDMEIVGTANNPTTINWPGSLGLVTESYTYNASDFPVTQMLKSSDGSLVATTSYSYY